MTHELYVKMTANQPDFHEVPLGSFLFRKPAAEK
jgi:hypothetical protein